MAGLFDDVLGSQSGQRPGGLFDDVLKPDDRPDFTRGFGVAMGQLAPLAKGAGGLVGATAEKALGEGGVSTAVKNWGLKGYQEGMAKLQPEQKDTDELTTAWDRAKSGDLGALVDWAQYGLGYGAGQLLTAGATAVAGGIIGSAVAGPAGTVAGAAEGAISGGAVRAAAQRMIAPLVEKEVAQIAATEAGAKMAADQVTRLATANVAKSIGQSVALTGYAGVQEAGSIYPEAVDHAKKEGRELDGADLARVWATTAGAAAVEGFTDKLGLGALTGKVKLPGAGGMLARGATGAATIGAAEGLTEGAQTFLERVGAGKSLTDEEAVKDYINSAGLGAIGGAPIGAIGGALNRPGAAPAPAPANPDAKLDRSLDQLQRARDEVYLGGQPPAATIAQVVSAPDLDTAINAAEASVPSMQQLMDEKRLTAANAARQALGETIASPSFDVNQVVADANARREAAIAGIQADLGTPQAMSTDRRTADQIVADFEAGRAAPAQQQGADQQPAAADRGQQLESVKAALRDRGLMAQASPQDRQQLLSIATTLSNPKLPDATRADLAQQAFNIIGQYQAAMQPDQQYLGNTAASGPAVLNNVPDTNVLPATRPPATPQAPLEFTPTETLQAGTELGAAPNNRIEGIEPNGLVRAVDDPTTDLEAQTSQGAGPAYAAGDAIEPVGLVPPRPGQLAAPKQETPLTTSLGAAPVNSVDAIEPTGLVRAVDEPALTGGPSATKQSQIPAVPGLPGVADTLNVNLAGQAGATEQQNADLLNSSGDPGTELAKQRVAAGYQAPPSAPRPQKVNGTPAAQLTDEQLNQIAADEKLPAIARRGAQIELGYRRSEMQPAAAAATPASPDVPPTGETPSEMYRKTMRYGSGLSAVGDLGSGSIASGGLETRGVGVDVGELSKNAITTIGNAVANLRTALFVDSGAFGAFRRGLKSGQFAPMNFDAILSKYDDILTAIDEANPAEETDYPRPRFVMPDVVGNQTASLELLDKYKSWISAEAKGTRAQLIIPIQKGKLSMAEAYRAAVNTLGTDNFIVGIPSNEAAVSPKELTEFLRDARPKAIHVLGAASEKNLTPRLQSVIDSGLAGQIEVTADASPIRSAVLNAVSKGAKRGDAIKEFLFDQQDPAIVRDNQRAGVKASEQRVSSEATNVAFEATNVAPDANSAAETMQQGKPVSNLGNITIVDPATLQTNSKASSGTISKQTHRMVSLIGSMFGKKVVLFSSDNEMAPDGFVRTGDSKTIHLNVKSQMSHLVVFGHELLHQLKADNPQAYAALMKVIKLNEGADTNVAGIRGDMEELTADVVGNRFRETEFWRDVFREILASGTDTQVSQRSAMRLGASVVRTVDRMVKALKGMTGFDTDSMVSNLGEVKAAVTKALASYAQQKRGEATELIRQEAAGQQAPSTGTTGDVVASQRRADFANPEDRLEVSTTRPVPAPKKGRTSNSYDEKWVIDGEDVRSSKNHVNAVMRALREYNTLSGKGNAAKLMQELHDVVVENLLWLHDLVPENVRERAKLWYDGANRIATDWTGKYGISLRQSSGVLAVLSPQMDWFKNVSLGERVISIWKNRQNEAWSPAMTAWLQSWVNASKDVETKASRQAIFEEARPLQGVTLAEMSDRQAALFVRVFDETYHERQYRLVTPEGGFGDYVSNSDDGDASVTWGGFDTIEKAVSILNDGSFRNIDAKLGDEHKVRNFYNNIISPGSADGHVTIDTHAVAAALVKGLSGSSREVADNFGSAGQNAETGASGTYGLFADAYRDAAAQRGLLPREMQSITWEAVRALFPASIKDQLAPQVDAVWNRFKKGELTRDQAREEVRKLAGGVRKMAWEGSDAGKAAADGGTSFNTEINDDPAQRQARTLPPEVAKDKVQANLSANTSSIPGVAALQDQAAKGDMLAHRLLQDIALDNLRHLLAGTSARVKADGVTGLYGGYVESGLSMTVTFADDDRAAVLAALAKFADNFNQEQVHVRKGVKAKAGTTFGDGSYATPVYRWELKKALSRKQIENVIAQSGLYGLTFGDDFVEAYYVGDPSNEAAITGFEQAIDRAGRLVGRAAESAGRSVERLWAYGDSARGLGFERIQGDVPAGTGVSSKTATRVAGYLNAVKDKDGNPQLGKVKTFDQAAEISPQQAALQERIAQAYESLPDNDLKNPSVRKAYNELAKEVLRQFKALPVKVEVMNGQGEPYANSAAMRRDILDNNHLFIFGTTPDTFGPPGEDFTGHPLLGQTGLKDQNGYDLLYNDLLRAVHDYYAHAMSPTQFGPKGEEAAWKNHMSMTNNMWARWALTAETRGQNSWVNFRDGVQDLPISQRGFAPQKAALLPAQYSLTGDRTVDKPMKEFIAGLSERVQQGSKPVKATKKQADSGIKASDKRVVDGADAIAAMDEDARDNMELGDAPGGPAAYNLYEARKLLKKPSDKLKRVTDSNSFSLWQDYDAIANVDGTLFGVTKQEDPDADPDVDEDNAPFIYNFFRLDNPDAKPGETYNSDVGDLFDAMRASLANVQASEKRIFDDSGRAYTPEQKAFFQNVGRTQEVPTIRERLANLRKDIGKKMAQGIADQFTPIKDLSKKAYALARLSKGSAGAVEALLKHGKLKLVDGVYDADTTGGALERVFMPLQNEVSDFLWWVAAQRADQLSQQDRENLFTPADISAGKSLDNGTVDFDYTLRNGKTTRDRTLIFRDALANYDEFNQNVLDMAEQSGLISSDVRKTLGAAMYVPFYRESEDGTVYGSGSSAALVRQQAFKKLKGGEQKLKPDLLQNVMMNWGNIIDASAKNRAGLETLKAAQQMGVAIEAPEATVRDMGRSTGNRQGVVWVQDQGVKRYFLVEDPYLLTAISSLQYSGMKGPIMDAMSAFKHWLTIGVTSSPAFKIRNLVRDSITAIGTAPLSANLLENLGSGASSAYKKDQSFVSALAGGGLIRFNDMVEGNQSARVRQLIRMGTDDSTILDSDDKIQTLRNKFEKAFMAYNELGNISEEVNRLALYKKLKADGLSDAEANLAARDLMDFSMQGTWSSVRFLTQVVPFLNARIQGLYKLGRATKEDPARIAAVLGAVAGVSLALAAGYSDDDDWKKREDWDRNNNWWFKFGGVVYRIPKPFEIGAVATLAERGADFLWDKNMTPARYGKIVKDLLLDNLSMNPIPQAFKPILDIYANKNSFTGRPIETMGMERLRPDYRFTQGTSMLARGVSTAGQSVVEATGLSRTGTQFLSPVQVDALLQGYFSWLGSLVVGTSDIILRQATGQPTKATPDYYKLATQGIAAEVDSGSSYFVSSLYDQAKVIEQSYSTWRQLLKQGKVQEAADFFKANKEDITKYRSIERVKSGEAKFNEMIRMIERSAKDPDLKKAEIQRIRNQQDRLARLVTEVR